jgi:site-specific recombinase XerD
MADEPRLALNRAVILRFRLYLESLGSAAGTINQRLAAVRRLAYEAADSGLLSPELAAGIRRVKGVKQLRSRLGNWLSSDQAKLLLESAEGEDLRSIRDVAMMAVLPPDASMVPKCLSMNNANVSLNRQR